MELTLDGDRQVFHETTVKYLGAVADAAQIRDLRRNPVGWPDGYWQQGAELGWTSLLVGEADGGGSIGESGLADLCLVAFEFGRHAAPGPLIPTSVVGSALSRLGTDAQKDAVLPGLLAGEEIVGWAHEELGGLGSVETSARRDGDDWILSGTKAPVESGTQASHFLVSATTPAGVSQFLVPADAPGVEVEAMGSVDLTKRFAVVRLVDVRLDAGALVGADGSGAVELERQLQTALVLQAAESVGAMDRALEITIEWAFDRYSFGRPLASYQEIKHRFADMKLWLEASHGIADGARDAVVATAGDAAELVSVAKSYIGSFGPELCQDCVQIHGGIGVTFEHDLHLFLRRVVLNRNLFGTVEDHRERITGLLEAADA